MAAAHVPTAATLLLAGVLGAVGLVHRFDCPAPRSPINGYAVIFQDGRLVRYACRPGYGLRGRPVAYCVGARWGNPKPFCEQMYQEFSSKTSFSNEDSKDLASIRDIRNQSNATAPKPGFTSTSSNDLAPVSRSQEDLYEASIETLRQEQLDGIRKSRINRRFKQASLGHHYSRSRLHRKRDRRRHHMKKPSQFRRKTIVINASTNINSPSSLDNTIYRNSANGSLLDLEREAVLGAKLSVKLAKALAKFRPVRFKREGYISPINLPLTDESCFEILSGGTMVPIRAPEVPNASVVGYHRIQRDHTYYHLYALIARYRCHHGYVPEDPMSNSLLCQDGKWHGDRIKCISTAP